MKKLITATKSCLLNLLFPAECFSCRQEGGWLCSQCFARLKFNDQNQNYNLVVPVLSGIFIAGDYDDRLLAELIKKFKYHFFSILGEPLGRFLISFWSQQLARAEGSNSARKSRLAPNKDFPARAPLLIPVPLSKKRLRWRGFNQADILARELSTHFGYDMNASLRRVRHQAPQATLSEKERLDNMKNAFAWSGELLDGRTIILIDDVATTGATLNEAALTLCKAGAVKIYGLVLAKG